VTSKITDKFQITIPKKIREILKLKKSDLLEWRVEDGRVTVESVEKPFLKHKGSVKIGEGDITQDIQKARREMGRAK
jgi:AbrB family looped-hinge helix DNA binding protein